MKGIDACIVDIGEGEEAFLQGARRRLTPTMHRRSCRSFATPTRASARGSRGGRCWPAAYATYRPGGRGLTYSRRLREPEARRALAAALDGIDVSGGALTIRGAAAACADAVPTAATALAARWHDAEGVNQA